VTSLFLPRGDHWKSAKRTNWRWHWHQRTAYCRPVINIHSWLSPRIFEKIWSSPNGILGGPGDTDSWKNLKSQILFQTPFKDFYISGRRVRTNFSCFKMSHFTPRKQIIWRV
jgi:hypothetical protein